MRKRNKEVVPFHQNAEFYFRVGIKYANRKLFHIARRYMERAAGLEPFNGDFQFNLACILAELKECKKSNAILFDILKNMDPTLTECYFGIACNYFDMGSFKKAKEYFEKYIYFDPQGQFTEEAFDILYYLQVYEDVGPAGTRQKNFSRLVREGRDLLGRGEFSKAIAKLEKAVEVNPEAAEPRNELSVALFCLGDEEKALSVARSVLKLEPENITAQCNLLLFYASTRKLKEYDSQLKVLSELPVEHKEDFIKLLDTYIKLEDHFNIIRIMIQYLKENSEPVFYHMVAVAFHNLKQYENAGDIWEAMWQFYPQYHLLVGHHLQMNSEVQKGSKEFKGMEYTTKLPENTAEHAKTLLGQLLDGDKDSIVKLWHETGSHKSILLYYLFEGTLELKKQILHKLLETKEVAILDHLKGMLGMNYVSEELRQVIAKSLGIRNRKPRDKEPGKVRLQSIQGLKRVPLKWQKEWDGVIDCAVKNRESAYTPGYKQELQYIWGDLMEKSGTRSLPVTGKREIWAAVLEYLYCVKNRIDVTKKDLARKYRVSAATITRKLREMGR